MGIIAKQSSWNFIILYLGVALGVVNNFVMAHAMSPEELGIVGILMSMMLLGGQIALFGGAQSIIKFYPKLGKESATGFAYFILRNTLISLGIAIITYFCIEDLLIGFYEDRSSIFGNYALLYIPLLTFFVFQEFFGSYVRSLLKSVAHTFVREVLLRLYQGILFILLMTSVIHFDVFLVLYVGGYLLTATIYGIIAITSDAKNFSFGRKLDRKSKREITRFSWAIFTTGISGAALGNIDVIMIGAIAPVVASMDGTLDGVDLAGVYSRMLFMAVLILVPLRSIQNIAVPLVSRAWSKKDYGDLKSVYMKSSLTMMIIGVVTFAGIWVNIDYILSLFPEHFVIGKYAFLVLAVGNLIQLSLGVNGPIIWNSPKYIVSSIGVPLLAIIAIVSNYYFIPRYGIVGAAFATVLSKFIFNLAMYLFLLIQYKMQPFTWRNMYVIGVGVAIVLLVDLIPDQGSLVLDVLVRSVVVLILFIPAIIVPKISAEINEMTGNVLKRIWPGKSF